MDLIRRVEHVDWCAQCGEAEIDRESNTLWCADCLKRLQEEYLQEYELAVGRRRTCFDCAGVGCGYCRYTGSIPA